MAEGTLLTGAQIRVLRDLAPGPDTLVRVEQAPDGAAIVACLPEGWYRIEADGIRARTAEPRRNQASTEGSE